MPAFRALRAAAPHAEISLIGLPWAQLLVERYPRYIDRLQVFPGAPGFPERLASSRESQRFQYEMAAQRFDLVIQMHGSGELTNAIVAGFGAHHRAGFHPVGRRPPGNSFMPWPEAGHEIERCNALMRFLGAPDAGSQLQLPLTGNDRVEAAMLLGIHGIGDRYVCVHAGARLPSRRWPIAHFACLVRALARDGWPVLLTGSADEAELTRRVLEAAYEPGSRQIILDCAGKTSLGGLAALIAGARLLVSNDTGVSHVAAALATPSVIVSSGGDARRWAPLDAELHPVLWHDQPCRPCLHNHCPIGHPCAVAITPGAVIEHARTALQRPVRHVA